MTQLIKALFNSMNGLILTWKEEWAFRLEIIASFLILPFVFWIPGDKTDKVFVLFSFALVLMSELMNTALEKANDAHTKEPNPLIKFSKDAASASVLIALCLAGVSLVNLLFF
ncbi:MAG: hypothetical protein ACD_16C00209G0019 [uncultured bacterium]|nr:MAG: hypothetical protein ACD_16C00209G0019 [uncultured bacterium]OFW68443.1 MAG: hypothetical protein A2X70_07085 [Alphaproteobacteria bacterium GWC2_42_16]OFW72975.1 MAG: hypothetical protein A2Z80_02845 [Alphaproteobacteria bacterium GWA2_41_27]OFW81535.1 MAG: hypothetical protein A3E50_05210 [Alphaproteobacteria bacterium RIFCSPHIGHO2_12_FULL_42_100]OFW86787.1 MAG: hypothetical protein A2W06_06130 [Alphaproteobacteria bacterium RBG_16_42_14]OFW90461.1 MAG: hypothetical protein A3C41_060